MEREAFFWMCMALMFLPWAAVALAIGIIQEHSKKQKDQRRRAEARAYLRRVEWNRKHRPWAWPGLPTPDEQEEHG